MFAWFYKQVIWILLPRDMMSNWKRVKWIEKKVDKLSRNHVNSWDKTQELIQGLRLQKIIISTKACKLVRQNIRNNSRPNTSVNNNQHKIMCLISYTVTEILPTTKHQSLGHGQRRASSGGRWWRTESTVVPGSICECSICPPLRWSCSSESAASGLHFDT